MTPVPLPSLLPNSYLLAYAIPLLLLSVAATFAGAFLTLDRTRTFTPIDKPSVIASEGGRGPTWRLEGGVGGIISGWLCGLHLTTYFSLLVLNRSSLGLQDVQFLVIWVLSSTLLALIGGRWRIAASVFYSLIGGAGITVLLTIIFLPESLLPRLIICAVLVIAFLVGTLVPLPPLIRHWALRSCASFSGSVSLIISIALLTNAQSWGSAWLLFAVAPVVGHRNSQEKGLSAGMFLIAGAGISVDWGLKVKLGEDPDKAWDEYLARYSKDLPLSSHREGLYEPPKSIWSRIVEAFGNGKAPTFQYNQPKDILFPPDSQLLPTSSLSKPRPSTESVMSTAAPPTFRPFSPKRSPTVGIRRKGTLSKMSPKLGYSDDSSDDEQSSGDEVTPKFRPWLKKRQSSTNSAATTVIGSDPLIVPKPLEKVEEYSDVEDTQGLSTAARGSKDDREQPGWKPAFIRHHQEKVEAKRRASLKGAKSRLVSSNDGGIAVPPRLTSSPTPLTAQNTSDATLGSRRVSDSLAVPPGAVPATPSLIRAYDRITRAQQEAQSRASMSGDATDRPTASRTVTGVAAVDAKIELDEGFWTKVKAKAAEYRQPQPGVVPGEP